MTSGSTAKKQRRNVVLTQPKRPAPKATGALGMVCYPPSGLNPDTVVSIMGSMVQDPRYFNGNFFLKKTGPSIDEARNQVAEFFLNTKPASGDYLVFVDSDQVWEPQQMYDFLDRAGTNGVQQVSALIPRYVEPTREIECPFVVRARPIEGYVETMAMAGGIYALRRDLIEELWGRWGSAFVSAEIGMHEDTMLGQRIKTIGKPLLVDTKFSVGHVKAMTLRFPDDFEV